MQPSPQEEALQAERNAASKAIGQMMAQGKKDEAEAAKEARARRSTTSWTWWDASARRPTPPCATCSWPTPSMPADSTPVGDDEDDNPEARRWGTPRDFAAEGVAPSRIGTWVPTWASLTSSAA